MQRTASRLFKVFARWCIDEVEAAEASVHDSSTQGKWINFLDCPVKIHRATMQSLAEEACRFGHVKWHPNN